MRRGEALAVATGVLVLLSVLYIAEAGFEEILKRPEDQNVVIGVYDGLDGAVSAVRRLSLLSAFSSHMFPP